MSAYTVDDLRRELDDVLAPHSISVGIVVATEHDVTIDAVRLNGTEHRRTFSLHVVTFTPALVGRFAELVREYYDLRH